MCITPGTKSTIINKYGKLKACNTSFEVNTKSLKLNTFKELVKTKVKSHKKELEVS